MHDARILRMYRCCRYLHLPYQVPYTITCRVLFYISNSSHRGGKNIASTTSIAIVGGGLASLLLASRLTNRLPLLALTVFEQEANIGGRLCNKDPSLHSISIELASYWEQTLRSDPEAEDLHELATIKPLDPIAILTGGKMVAVARADVFSEATIKLLANRSVAKYWQQFIADTSNKNIKSIDRHFTTTLGKLVPLLGLASTEGVSIKACQQRITAFNAREAVHADWQKAVAKLTNTSMQIHTDCQVYAAQHRNNKWCIASKMGESEHDILVVAQPLVSVDSWLEKKYLRMFGIRKALPASSLCLGLAIDNELELPAPTLLIANERAIIYKDKGMLVASTPLAFEVSLQATKTVQALGRLKRASQTLLKLFPHVTAQRKWVALLPAAYPVSLAFDLKNCPANLYFCGDNYGNSEDGDRNLLVSILYTSDRIVELFK